MLIDFKFNFMTTLNKMVKLSYIGVGIAARELH